jgi:hypothetical protein
MKANGMRDLIKLGDELRARIVEESDVMLAERTMMRDILETRGRELLAKRDEEVRRIDRWADSQKEIVRDVFAAMVAENDADKQKHESAIKRLLGDSGSQAGGAAGQGPKLVSNARVSAAE